MLMIGFSLVHLAFRVFHSLALSVLVLLGQKALAADSVEFTKDNARITITADGKTLLKYKYAEVPCKPYVEEFYSPAGVNVLRDAPADHLHHHGLMLAVKVDGVNFW